MKFGITTASFTYKKIFRPIFFQFDSESVHTFLVGIGETLGKIPPVRAAARAMLRVDDPSLAHTVAGIRFENPIGLAAGFDYRAQLSDILPSIGFGFGTIGSITNHPYEGNPAPRLGRLIKSRSLMVNKGFKNDGIYAVLKKLQGKTFLFPVGLSIGKTNSTSPMTQEEAVQDVVETFRKSELSKIPFSYYELNISCPNLYGSVTFYPPENLRALLAAVTALTLSHPLFIKMPIEKTDAETSAMLDVILQFPVAGVIFGNLQKNRQDPAIIPSEAAKYTVGNWSGMPTQKRSDELVRLAYRKVHGKMTVIGCGGIFSAEDAYRKIRLGASLIQFITGLIYEGPQLAAAINAGLVELLRRDGFKNIAEAVGKDA